MLHSVGFTDKWIHWTQRILETGSSPLLPNGVPGKCFDCKRGVRQGDPLSLLLFVLAIDLPQCIINKAHQQSLMSMPIEVDPSGNLPIIQYADDTIPIIKASQIELFYLKALLQSFAESTRLIINALLLKFLHKFYNHADLPWVHLTWM